MPVLFRYKCDISDLHIYSKLLKNKFVSCVLLCYNLFIKGESKDMTSLNNGGGRLS